MSEGKGQRKWPIPPGFHWSHNDDRFVHADGRKWDPDTNEVFDKDGTKLCDNAMVPSPQFVDSTSDARVVNNVMRHEYRVLTEQEKGHMKSFKDFGLEFHAFCDHVGQSRELSLAKTKIEEAVMWAVKHVTK